MCSCQDLGTALSELRCGGRNPRCGKRSWDEPLPVIHQLLMRNSSSHLPKIMPEVCVSHRNWGWCRQTVPHQMWDEEAELAVSAAAPLIY